MIAGMDKGLLLLLLLLAALLGPAQWVAYALYALGSAVALGLLLMLVVAQSHHRSTGTPSWAKVAMAPLRGVLVLNLALVAAALATLWHFHPLFGGAA